MTQTQKQRVLAQIAHRETRPVPYTTQLPDEVAERLDAHYGGTAWRASVDDAIRRIPSAVPGADGWPKPVARDAYGSVWRTDRRPVHLVEPVLKEPSLRGYQFPPVDSFCTAEWEQLARETIAACPDHFTTAGLSYGLFERSWALRGFEESLMDAVAEPAFYGGLMERIAEHHLAIVERLLALPVDGIMFGDDWGYQQGVLLGPERWRRFIKPHYTRIYARVHAAGRLVLSHCCGSVVDILPDIIEMGLDVLESVQPEARGMNPYDLKRRFGRDITFWGGLGAQSTVPFGTPDEIRAEVRRLCREMGRGGGYILAAAKPMEADTPVENAAAVIEAFTRQE